VVEIRDDDIIRLSLICSVLGLIMLYFVVSLELSVIPISEITKDSIGNKILVQGTVVSKYVSEKGHTFFNIDDGTGSIDVVMFNMLENMEEGRKVSVKGKVDEYKGKLEIIADSVSFI